jgi:DNA-binding MarR family transcriptional regulator
MVTRRVGQFVERVARPTTKTNPTYGRVFFALRQRLGLSVSACLLADVVEILSRRTGWCFASREYLADLLGVSPRSLRRLLHELESRGLIERDLSRRRQLRPSRRWHAAKVAALGGQDGR